MVRQTAWLSSLGVVMVTVGCHSMSGLSLPMQEMSRVPPPGTGSYQAPQAYYNQSSSLNNTSMQQQFADQRVSPPTSEATAGDARGLPSTSGTNGGVVNRYTQSSNPASEANRGAASSDGAVVTASYSSNASSPSAPATRSIGDSTESGEGGAGQAGLPWQP